ncbi:MAG: hypothetical protein KGL35_07720 [Bradyrhizobium sp.]|nr:hypothetical protein [Bradyrhizobium sp.]
MSARPAAKRPRKPVYLRVERLVRPDTGEIVGALVPRYGCDKRAMRERGYTTGTEIRAELKKPRNAKFHRLMHALGALLVDQADGLEDLDAHGAIKRLQRETGVQCDEMSIDVPGIGSLAVKMPRSIAFDEMEEGDFSQLWAAIVRHASAKYLHGMTTEAIEEFAEMTAETHA